VLLFVRALARGAFAHEVRPAYLELRQTAPETYDVLWKVPARGEDLRLALYVEMTAGTTELTAPRGEAGGGSFTERWTVRSPGGLGGRTIRMPGSTRR